LVVFGLGILVVLGVFGGFDVGIGLWLILRFGSSVVVRNELPANLEFATVVKIPTQTAIIEMQPIFTADSLQAVTLAIK
jgi:hypothetical protein